MRILICNIVPNQLVVRLRAPQAPNNFCFNLIENNAFDSTISLVPPSYFYEGISDENNIKYLGGKSLNCMLIRRIYTMWNGVKAAWMARGAESVWFYNICMTNIVTYILLRFIFRTRVYAILLDYTPEKSKLSLNHYIPWLYSKSYGMITLSERTKIRHPHSICKAGIISLNKIKSIETYKQNKKLSFLFSGCLDEHTGFFLALDVFKQLPDSELYISGIGVVDEQELKQYSNIHYLGYMNYEDYLRLYDKIDVCLSLRNPDFEENMNNFPSKILEYFSYGKIVLSTLEYPELSDFEYSRCNYSVEDLKQAILHLQSISLERLNMLCDNRNALINNFSGESWKSTFSKIESL